MALRTTALLSIILASLSAARADDLKLSLPVDCVIGDTCFIQQYVDVDPGPGARDYRGGSAVYNKHKGTDIRVRTLADAARGVKVLAAAPGKVLGIRDGVADRVVFSARDRERIRDIYCGNGVLIDHGDGWHTQYCHLRRNSVLVQRGDQVERGQVLGLVGYSGLAQFPHLHIAVRRHGRTLDPFTSKPITGAEDAGQPVSLWDETARQQLKYREGRMLYSGFATGAVEPADVLKRLPDEDAIASNSPALVAYGWWINLQKGDRVVTRLTGPGGRISSHTSEPLNRAKAQFVQFSGKPRPTGGWPAGIYRSDVAIIRDGRQIMKQRRSLEIR
ncbi:MAG: M23 family metallopeptidase [Pseudomonadota bacterium]